jgi:hypothetical protein
LHFPVLSLAVLLLTAEFPECQVALILEIALIKYHHQQHLDRQEFTSAIFLNADVKRMEGETPPLTFKRRIKSHLPFAGIIRSSPYSTRFQDNG